MGSFIERAIEREIDSINDHLPQNTLPLSEFRENPHLSYVTKGGEQSSFRKEEIQFLLQEVPSHLQNELRLPIVILRRMDLGPGIYTITGGRVAAFLLHRALGDVDLRWEDLASWRSETTLARPQVQVIRRRLPTTTCIGFAHSIPRKAFTTRTSWTGD